MEKTTIKDIQKSHRASVERLRTQMDEARKSAEVTVDLVLDQKKELLGRVEERLKRAQEAKAAAIRRFDEDIRHYEGVLSRLRKEIEVDEKQLAEAEAVAKKPKKAAKRPRKASEKPGRRTSKSS